MIPLLELKRSKSIDYIYYGLFYSLNGLKSYDGVEREYICLRSIGKLFQTLTCLKLGLNLTEKQIALCTSSHSGTDEHVLLIKALLKKFKLNWKDLGCGEHAPLDGKINFARKNTEKRRLQNNCSAKHAMLLATCQLIGWDTTYYKSAQHPIQKAIKNTISTLCETNDIEISLDGCDLPTFIMQIHNLLIGFAKFNINNQDKYISSITKAFLNHPILISGKNRLDCELTNIYKPKIISKSGAGGITAISFQDKTNNALLLKINSEDQHAKALIIKKLLNTQEILQKHESALFQEKKTNLLNKPFAHYNYS